MTISPSRDLSSKTSSHKHTPFLPQNSFFSSLPSPLFLSAIRQSAFSLLSAAIITSPHFALTSEMIKRDHLFCARGEKHAVRQPRACARGPHTVARRVFSHGAGEPLRFVCAPGWIFTLVAWHINVAGDKCQIMTRVRCFKEH